MRVSFDFAILPQEFVLKNYLSKCVKKKVPGYSLQQVIGNNLYVL